MEHPWEAWRWLRAYQVDNESNCADGNETHQQQQHLRLRLAAARQEMRIQGERLRSNLGENLRQIALKAPPVDLWVVQRYWHINDVTRGRLNRIAALIIAQSQACDLGPVEVPRSTSDHANVNSISTQSQLIPRDETPLTAGASPHCNNDDGQGSRRKTNQCESKKGSRMGLGVLEERIRPHEEAHAPDPTHRQSQISPSGD